jgi:hypothetical protein
MTLQENDVRLMRRYLVARMIDDQEAMKIIERYLKEDRGLVLLMPYEQNDMITANFTARNQANEKYLVQRFGCVIMVDYTEAIFLNSKWANPYALYVRLVEEVPDLGELGKINWVPEKIKDRWPEVAEKNHQLYIEQGYLGPTVQRSAATPKKPGILERIFGR